MIPKRFAFAGRMGVGKDTSCDYLVKTFGGRKLSFAAPLYSILHHAQQVCGFPIQKDRKFLQWVGTEWARSREPNIWVSLLLRDAEKEEGHVYVSDLRFVNEFWALKAEGFKLIKLNRNEPTLDFAIGTGSTTHSSEHDLDYVPITDWDVVIDNNGSTEELFTKLRNLFLSEASENL